MAKRIFFLLNISASKNPMLNGYIDALSRNYEIYISAPDVPFKSDIKAYKVPGILLRSFKKLLVLVIKFIKAGLIVVSFSKPNSASRERINHVIDALYFLLDHFILTASHAYFVTRNRADFIISIDAGGMSAARIIKFLLKVPYAYAVYEVYPDQFLKIGELQRQIMKKIECRGAQHAAVLFDPGNNLFSKFIRRRYKLRHLSSEAIFVCPGKVECLSSLHVHHPIKIYYHGILIQDRGLEELVTSMAHFKDQFHLFIRGFGPLKETLEKIVQAKNIGDRVFFLDPLPPDKLAEAAAEFDIGVTLAKKTTLNGKFVVGFKTLENINAGLAIMALDSYVLHELINQTKVGVTFKDATIDDLTAALHQLTDPDVVKNYKIASRRITSDFLNRETQSAKLNTIVKRIIGS
ncbi:MAG: glycosyltransferase [Flavisolibacter sp.]|nr:glycosyltransferase [Flavisolibacter sp.]